MGNPRFCDCQCLCVQTWEWWLGAYFCFVGWVSHVFRISFVR